ncbi:hypothetical protein [Nocardia wallacei]|uniref:hypothetical protein n=1 Tax=Nocardia wallacei TaxID=480035 RepID=UPI0024575196|nr:hypothetical protein [Nocardia wallacei]
MVQPTPWQANKIRQRPVLVLDVPGGRTRRSRWRAVRSALAGRWGFACAAMGNALVLALLFAPWLTAAGFDGKVRVDAFGRIEASTLLMNAWAHSPPDIAKINGGWGILAAAVGVHTVLVALAALRFRTRALTRLATASTVASALSTLTALLYLNSHAPQVKAMVGLSHDLGGQIGWLLSDYFGTSQFALPGSRPMTYTNATLTPWPLLALALAVACAVAVVIQWLRGSGRGE